MRITGVSRNNQLGQIEDALAWFRTDAIVHLSTPRGLDQPNGGAWGMRDVCQGPVEFLLSYDHGDLVAEIIRKVFAQQYQQRARLAPVVHVSAFSGDPIEHMRMATC